MNPYEETAAEMKRQSEGPKRFAKQALGVGAGALGVSSFAPILARAAPFLSEYIPEDLAIKGLLKISPKLGNFVKDAMKSGYDFKETKDFIGEQVKESQQAKDNRNIIEQHSPELHQFILERIKNGQSPIQAAALATIKGSKFLPIIEKLKKEHKLGWGDIVQNIYGSGEQAPSKQKKKPMVDEETERFEQGYRNQQPTALGEDVLNPPHSLPQQKTLKHNPGDINTLNPKFVQRSDQGQRGQGGPGQQALMDVLNKINQRLGQ